MSCSRCDGFRAATHSTTNSAASFGAAATGRNSRARRPGASVATLAAAGTSASGETAGPKPAGAQAGARPEPAGTAGAASPSGEQSSRS